MAHKWQCRYSPTLGALEGSPDDVWGTKPYLDEFQDTVFMGMYSLKDFQALWNHKGRKAILWCGSDITRFISGWWLDVEGMIKIEPEAFAEWINKNCENYVENGVEHEALMVMGIESRIIPSFLGNVEDYSVEYQAKGRPKVYTSVSGNDYELYGWYKIRTLAEQNPGIEFHLYGSTGAFAQCAGLENVIDHGRVPKEQMNEEIKTMHAALRLTEFDGCSEIIVKAMLWGQYAFGNIYYPGVFSVDELPLLEIKTLPNPARGWWLNNLNKYPWNLKNI